MSDTPETDKIYDMVSDREAPNYNMVGHLPSKWSYEAILDLTDHARRLERQRNAAVEALTMAKEYIFNPFEKDNQCNTYHRICAVLREIEGKS